MNLHINGTEMRTIDLTVEAVGARHSATLAAALKGSKYRAIIKGDRAALNRVFKTQPAKLVLERSPSDPSLAVALPAGLDVRIRGHKFKVYRRDTIRNKIWMRRVEL